MRFIHQNFQAKSEARITDYLHYEPHMHNAIEIITMFEGICTLIIQGVEYTIKAGDMLVVFPNCIHSYISESDTKAGVIIFDTERYPEIKNIIADKLPVSPVIPAAKLKNTDIPLLAEKIIVNYKNSSRITKKGYILLLFGSLLEHCPLEETDRKHDDILSGILAYCRENYRNKLTVKEVAKKLHISTSYLSHVFSSGMKIGFCDYVNILRVNEAARLLRESDKSITEVTDLSGFGSIRSFNRAFLKHTGMAPMEYRKSMN